MYKIAYIFVIQKFGYMELNEYYILVVNKE